MSPTPPAAPAPSLLSLARAVAAPLLLLGACWAGSGAFPTPDENWERRVAIYGSVLVIYLLVAWLVSALVPVALWGRRTLVVSAVVLLALAMAGNLLELAGVTDAVKLGFGAIVGVAIARMVERPWWLLPICVLVPLADAWSVFSDRGVTHAVVERAREDPTWINWPTIATPIAGYEYSASPRIGIVDVLFLAVFLTVAWNFHMGLVRGALLLPLGFVATNALIFEGAVPQAIPALPLLCLAFLMVYAGPLLRDACVAWRARARGRSA